MDEGRSNAGGGRDGKGIKNPLVRGISGSVGDMVFRQMPDGSTYVSGKPNFEARKFSQGQKDHQSRFRQGVAYAREAAKSQPVYAELAAGTIMSPYNWALSDWFNPPEIHKIERTEGCIRVWASDNVMVARVRVKILDGEEQIVEEGEAVWKVESGWWQFGSSAEGRVLAEAWDLAGNKVSLMVE